MVREMNFRSFGCSLDVEKTKPHMQMFYFIYSMRGYGVSSRGTFWQCRRTFWIGEKFLKNLISHALLSSVGGAARRTYMSEKWSYSSRVLCQLCHRVRCTSGKKYPFLEKPGTLYVGLLFIHTQWSAVLGSKPVATRCMNYLEGWDFTFRVEILCSILKTALDIFDQLRLNTCTRLAPQPHLVFGDAGRF